MVKDFIHILESGNLMQAGVLLDADLTFRAQGKLWEMKKAIMAKIIVGEGKVDRSKLDAFDKKLKKSQKEFADKLHKEAERGKKKAAGSLEEEDNLDEAGPTRIVRARIRGGKLQRRKKVATRPGYTIRGGKLVRMSPAERRKRKLGARKGKMKRKAKSAISNRKRAISLKKRQRLGL